MGEWEADLKVRERRLHNEKVNMESAEDKQYQVSLSYCRIIWVITKFCCLGIRYALWPWKRRVHRQLQCNIYLIN